MTEDERWMQMALDVAEMGRAQTSPNPLVGAVVVKDGRVVGQGAHLMAGGPHAEVHALRMAGEDAKGATIYVTLEPCNHHGRTPPCTEAILQSGISRVVVAVPDHDARTRELGISRLRAAGLEVVVGVCEDAAVRQNRAFFHRVDTGRPLVVYKVASTFSGHVAASNGHSRFVTGDLAREDVQQLRLQHPSIAVGIGTVLADNPQLSARPNGNAVPATQQPLRVVVDAFLRMPLAARMIREPGQTLVVTGETAAREHRQHVEALTGIGGVEVVAVHEVVPGRLSLGECLFAVADKGKNSLLLEGGPTLAAALLAEKLIDEVCIYLAPKLLVHGLPIFQGFATDSMDMAIQLKDIRYTSVGEDLRIDAAVSYEDSDVQDCLEGSRLRCSQD